MEHVLEKMYSAKKVYLFTNARSAEYIFLKSLNLPLDSEVVLQAFTCNAVVNPILWLKHTPVYVDISPKSFSMKVESLREKVSPRTGVVIVQHTFGINGYTDSIESFIRKKKAYVLEDCAHSLGNSKLGTKGDAAIVSFGIEKVLNTRVGGALIVNNPELIKALDIEYGDLKRMGTVESFLWLINPILWRMIRKLGPLQKVVSLTLKSLGLLNMGFIESELNGIKPRQYPKRLSPVLASIVLSSLNTIEENLEHRRYINDLYASALNVPQLRDVSTVRFPLIVDDLRVLEGVHKALDRKGIYYGDWYNPLIYPARTSIESMGYKWGECPVAEEVSRHILNLPTGFSIKKRDALDIANAIKGVFKETGYRP